MEGVRKYTQKKMFEDFEKAKESVYSIGEDIDMR